MATRCDCPWQAVSLHPELETLWLRADEVPGCPAHAQVREDTETSA